MVDPNVSYKAVHASRGRAVRAEPIAALYEQRRVHHVGTFPMLEDQMSAFTSDFSSISSHPLADLGWKLLIGLRHRLLLISRSSFVRAAKGRSFVPARRASIASRAGAVKAGRRAWLAAGSRRCQAAP
jgi:hypothetical protein